MPGPRRDGFSRTAAPGLRTAGSAARWIQPPRGTRPTYPPFVRRAGPAERPIPRAGGPAVALFAKRVGEGIPAVASEALSRDLDAARRPPPLVFRRVEQPLHARDGLAREAARHDLRHAQLLLDAAI